MQILRYPLLVIIVLFTGTVFSQSKEIKPGANFFYLNSSAKKACYSLSPRFLDESVCPEGDSCVSVLRVYRQEKMYKDTFVSPKYKDTLNKFVFENLILEDDGEYSFELEVMTLSDTAYKYKSVKNDFIQVYSPIVEGKSVIDTMFDPDFSFHLTYKVGENFKPFDETAWKYLWDFGDGTVTKSPIAEREITHEYTSASPEYGRSNEGYSVTLKILLDSTAIGINGCYETYTEIIDVRDHFFKSYDDLTGPMSGNVTGVNTIILNSNIDENRVFSFNVNGENWFEVYIFNRWGKLVEKIEGKKPVWDGRLNSSRQYVAPGVYYYVIRSDADNDLHERYGFLHVFDAESR